MTRELKLALIVGFFLVLLVSFLIADHLSASRKVELDSKLAQAQPPVAPMGAPGTPMVQEPDQSGPVITFTQGAGGGVATDPTLARKPNDPSVIAEVGSRVGQVLNGESNLPPAANTGTVSLGDFGMVTLSQNQTPGIDTLGARGAPSPDVSNATTPALKPTGDGVTPFTMVASPNSLTGQVPVATPAPTTPVDGVAPTRGSADSSPAPKAQEDRWHTIASGDTLFTIAKRYYGTSDAWRELAKYNSDRVGKNNSLRTGVRLRIPTPAKLGLKSTEAKTQPADQPSVRPQSEPRPQPKSTPKGETRVAKDDKPSDSKAAAKAASKTSGKTYTVKKGDTLSQISQRELGTIKRMDEILKLNNLKDAGAIRVGMTLKMPG